MARSRDSGEVRRDNVTAGREYECDASGSGRRRWSGQIGVKVGEKLGKKTTFFLSSLFFFSPSSSTSASCCFCLILSNSSLSASSRLRFSSSSLSSASRRAASSWSSAAAADASGERTLPRLQRRRGEEEKKRGPSVLPPLFLPGPASLIHLHRNNHGDSEHRWGSAEWAESVTSRDAE
ncbi:hypothetical protein EYF80_023464 [Liparis tanakae]|uniref:Uncharacterized protein n=1 Tax=Liparis tanakae TaxID=230148 RepID=A0A4Z2HKI7_9TELE|nr:hypothetical protein EYF80_023464 [Liparis tanakae]